MSAPTIQVLLGNFGGGFVYDITPFVRLVDGITISRGVPDEQSQIQAGTLTLTLENIDGAFSFNNSSTGFGLLPFGSGPFGSYGINVDQEIRVLVNGTNHFTGKVQAWPVSWPSGGDEFSVVEITALDDLARAARRPLRSAAAEEILADSPAAYYPMDEAQGAVVASDVTGNQQNPGLLNPLFLGVSGTNGSATFGTDLGTVDGATGVLLGGGGIVGTLLNANQSESWTSTSVAGIHFDIVLKPVLGASSPTNVVTFRLNGEPVSLTVSSGGVISFGQFGSPVITTGAVMTGNVTHVISINGDTSFTDLWLDGVKIATGAGLFGVWSNSLTTIGDAFNLVAGASLTVGQFNFGAKLADARVSVHHQAILNDLTGETPAARLRRACAYGLMFPGVLDTSGSTLMGPSAQAGRTAADLLADVAQATQGSVYEDGSGAITSVHGYTLMTQGAPNATLDANCFSPDTKIEVDATNRVNYATGKASGSENVTTALDANSIAFHGQYRADYEWNVSTDAQAANLTNWRVGVYKVTRPRIPTLTLDMWDLSGATLTAALTLNLGKFLRVTGLPSQAPSTVGDLLIFGLTETITEGSWTLSLNCVQRALYSAWLLDDTTYSVLDSTTTLFIG